MSPYMSYRKAERERERESQVMVHGTIRPIKSMSKYIKYWSFHQLYHPGWLQQQQGDFLNVERPTGAFPRILDPLKGSLSGGVYIYMKREKEIREDPCFLFLSRAKQQLTLLTALPLSGLDRECKWCPTCLSWFIPLMYITHPTIRLLE